VHTAQRDTFGPGTTDGLRRRLAAARTSDELFCAAAAAAREVCGFGRAIVLDVAGGELRAEITGDLRDESSEALRRRVIAHPVQLESGSVESDLVRGAPPGRNAESQLEDHLSLEDALIVPIAPEHAPVALLVADQPASGVDAFDALDFLAQLTAVTLTALVLRARINELSTEIRYLTASAHALLHEAQNAPISLARDHGQGLAFAHVGTVQHRRHEDDGLLTLREREIMDRVVAGRSNAEIAADLYLSIDTVKTHVGRLLRKFGATNRVGAVVAYLERRPERPS